MKYKVTFVKTDPAQFIGSAYKVGDIIYEKTWSEWMPSAWNTLMYMWRVLKVTKI